MNGNQIRTKDKMGKLNYSFEEGRIELHPMPGDATLRIDPEKDVKYMWFMYLKPGRELIIERDGYMDVLTRSIQDVKVSACVSIAGAEPGYRKRAHLPGAKPKDDSDFKCI